MNLKKKQRRIAYNARNAQPNKDRLSEIICNRFKNQLVYQQADTIMWYLHCRSEVRTLISVSTELNGSKKIIIPYCTIDQNGQNKLGLWWLQDLSELSPGTWNILEPHKHRWGEKGKEISPKELDLVMVPGVAFDRECGRLGNGAGYYDRLLQEVRADTELTAVCYESQLCDKVIMEKHDVYMNTVITETNCYYSK